jgi:uncharacterized membrane protein
MSKKIKGIVLGSLVLNVVLAGIILGGSPRRFDRDLRREQRIEQVLEGLPSDSQARLRERMREIRSAAEPHFTQIRRARDEAIRLLGADPFDQAALDGQVARILEFQAEMTKHMSEAIKTAIRDLTPEERRRFAEMLRRPPPPDRKN